MHSSPLSRTLLKAGEKIQYNQQKLAENEKQCSVLPLLDSSRYSSPTPCRESQMKSFLGSPEMFRIIRSVTKQVRASLQRHSHPQSPLLVMTNTGAREQIKAPGSTNCPRKHPKECKTLHTLYTMYSGLCFSRNVILEVERQCGKGENTALGIRWLESKPYCSLLITRCATFAHVGNHVSIGCITLLSLEWSFINLEMKTLHTRSVGSISESNYFIILSAIER